MQQVEMPEFEKIITGKLGDDEQHGKIMELLKQIFEQHGKFKVLDSLEKKTFVISVEAGEVSWHEEKKSEEPKDEKHKDAKHKDEKHKGDKEKKDKKKDK